jgi:hypothetical protein
MIQQLPVKLGRKNDVPQSLVPLQLGQLDVVTTAGSARIGRAVRGSNLLPQPTRRRPHYINRPTP